MNRRGFFGLLAGVPFLGWLVPKAKFEWNAGDFVKSAAAVIRRNPNKPEWINSYAYEPWQHMATLIYLPQGMTLEEFKAGRDLKQSERDARRSVGYKGR